MTTGRLLDVSALPFARMFVCKDGTEIDLADFVDLHYDVVKALAGNRLVKRTESFGFAMVAPTFETAEYVDLPDGYWDDPEGFVWFVGGWGPDRERYIANAVRKLRPLLRVERYPGLQASTLEFRFDFPGHFQDVVDSQNPDGTFPWGDFPWGGGVTVQMGPLTLSGAVSCFTEIEDDFVTRLLLGGLGKRIVAGNNLLPDD